MNEHLEIANAMPAVPRGCDLISDAVALVNALGISNAQAVPMIGARLAARIAPCACCGAAMESERAFLGCCGGACIEKMHGKNAVRKFYNQTKRGNHGEQY